MKAALTPCILLALPLLAWAGEGPPPVRPCGPLTLADAVERAIAASPDIRAASQNVRVRDALSVQAGARPNPEIQAEVENVGGSGSRQGFEETETTLRLAQRIELGGKRAARLQTAHSERSLAGWDYEVARLGVALSATKSFVATLAAQERLAVATWAERLAREAAAAVSASVDAGASAPVDAARARIAATRAGVEREQAERALDGARALLASSWGGQRPCFARVEGDLQAGPLPVEADLRAALDRNPALARFGDERDARLAAVSLERARRVPDLTVGAGGRHFSDNGDNALVFQVSMPLPVFDRNAGGIAAANERLVQLRDEADAARRAARLAFTEAYLRLAEAHGTALALERRVLPDARRALEQTLAVYRAGAVRSLDVFEARRALVDVERERIDALERYHLAAADIRQLTAEPVPSTPVETQGGVR